MDIIEFWDAFVNNQGKIRTITSVDDPAYVTLLNKLHDINSNLFLELSVGSDNKILIITAEGDQNLFSLVDAIVAQAPEISGWTIFALRPRDGFPVIATWEDYAINTADVVFDPIKLDDSPTVGLRLLVPNLNETDIDKCHSALLIAIDHGIGEREFAESIRGTIVVPLPHTEDASNYIPLVLLEDYLNWHKEHIQK